MDDIAAVILGAGQSSRMGDAKLLLPWGSTTVIGQVAGTFFSAGIRKILIVTGGYRDRVEQYITGKLSHLGVDARFNPVHRTGGMVSSLQTGLVSLDDTFQAALVALADQPQVEAITIQQLCNEWRKTAAPLVIPSHGNHRGHPWLVARSLWSGIMHLPAADTLQTFLRSHSDEITYIPGNATILQDMDTPADYLQSHP